MNPDLQISKNSEIDNSLVKELKLRFDTYSEAEKKRI